MREGNLVSPPSAQNPRTHLHFFTHTQVRIIPGRSGRSTLLCPPESMNLISDWRCRELELLAQKLANTEDEYEALYDQKLAGAQACY